MGAFEHAPMHPSRASSQAPSDSQSEPTARLVRPLGIQERVVHQVSGVHPRHFCVVAELGQKQRPWDYRSAFALIQQRHPLLSVFVAETENGPCFMRGDRKLDVTFISESDATDWRRVVERELASGFSD